MLFMKVNSDTKIKQKQRKKEAAFFLPKYNKRRIENERLISLENKRLAQNLLEKRSIYDTKQLSK